MRKEKDYGVLIIKPLLQWCRRFVDSYFGPGYCWTLDELAKRIYNNAVHSRVTKIPTPSSPFSANLPSLYLVWNKNPQCPTETFETLSKMTPLNTDTTKKSGKEAVEYEAWCPGETNNFYSGCLKISRHSQWKSMLNKIEYIERSSTSGEIVFQDGCKK